MVIIAFAISFCMGCSDVADEVRVRIISNGSDFSGWYDVDGDITVITGGTVTSNVYSYEATFDDIEDVEFDIITQDNAYSLTIIVYKNDKKVKSSSTTSSIIGGETLHLNLTYSPGEESSDDDDS
jgi:hypothetical protein